jgi:mono/diheme cytochrome c family protein
MMASKASGSLLVLAAVAVLMSAGAASAQTPAAPPADESRVGGRSVFTTYCASCHGESARGDGPVAQFLKRKPADLTRIAIRNNGTFPSDKVFAMIDGRNVVKTHGDSQMPVWGDAFSKATTDSDERGIKAKIDALVAHLESLQERPRP